MSGQLCLHSLPLPAGAFERLRNDKKFRNRMASLGAAKLRSAVTAYLSRLNKSQSAGELSALRTRIECKSTHAAFLRTHVSGARELLGVEVLEKWSEPAVSKLLEALIGILSTSNREQKLVRSLCKFAIPGRADESAAAAPVTRENDRKVDLAATSMHLVATSIQRFLDMSSHIDLLADACVSGDLDAVRREIAFTGVNCTVLGLTPLILACINERVEVAQFLLQNGADADTRTPVLRDTAIYGAAQVGHVDLIRMLLLNGADIDVSNDQGSTPLHVATDRIHHDAVRYLLEANASVAVRNNDGETPLLRAARNGSLACASLLLAHGAPVTASCRHGRTALFLAASNGHVKIVQMLLDAGSQVDARSNVGNTPLTAAIMGNHHDVVRMLLFAGADVTQTTTENQVCVGIALSSRAIDVIPLLIAAGADVNAFGDNPMTALIRASESSRDDVVALLLAGGANTALRDRRDQRTALDKAVHPNVRDLLIHAGGGIPVEGWDRASTEAIKCAREKIIDARGTLAVCRQASMRCVVCRELTLRRCVACGSCCCSVVCERAVETPHKVWCSPAHQVEPSQPVDDTSWFQRIFEFITYIVTGE